MLEFQLHHQAGNNGICRVSVEHLHENAGISTVHQAEDAGVSGTSANQAENAGICRILFPECGPCCALPNVAICAKIAIGTWKRTTTCVGAQT